MNTGVVTKWFRAGILLSAVFISSGTGSFAASGDPVLLEALGNFACTSDPSLQDNIKKIITDSPNVIFLNCEIDLTANDPRAIATGLDIPPLQKLCSQKKRAYHERLEVFGVRSMMFVVNGSFDARGDHVEPAIKASQSLQKVLKASVTKRSGYLDIRLPDLGMRTEAKIYLYGIKPTRDEQRIFVDSSVDMTPDVEREIRDNPFQSFVSQKRISPLSIRPAISVDEIGEWDGRNLSFSLPLPELGDLEETLQTMSYTLVVQEGDISGKVLALGQYLSGKEISWLSSRQDVFHGAILQSSMPPNM